MAMRSISALTVCLLGLATAVGCQQPVASSPYVAPSFGPPKLAAARPAPTAIPLPPPPPAMQVVPRLTPPPTVASRKGPPAVASAAVPRAWVPPVVARPWKWIVIHHSDTEHGGLAFIDKLHKANGWDGVGYDFVIGNGTDTGDGQIEPTYRWTRQVVGAHAKTPDNRFNEYGIGICLVGNMMVHAPTPAQMKAVEKLTAYLMATYHIAPDHMVGHGDTKNTDCPGRYTNLAAIRAIAARQAGGTAAIAGASYGKPTGEMLVAYHPKR